MRQRPPLTPAQKKKRRSARNALVRACIQDIFFFAMPGAFVAGFSGVKYLIRVSEVHLSYRFRHVAQDIGLRTRVMGPARANSTQ